MKASDYVESFKADGCTINSLSKVVISMITEVRDIGMQRKIHTDDGLFSILNEMDDKFTAFHRQTNGGLNDGPFMSKESFRLGLRSLMPDVFNAWNRYRGGRLLAD